MAEVKDYQSVQQIKRRRAAKLAKIIAGAYYRWRRKQTDDMYRFICIEFMALGGVYVKFLQGVLLRSEFMKRWDSPDRLRVFENLDTEPLDIEAVLAKELKIEARNRIISVNPIPFAAGSFGQVYYGTHSNGKPIIIKVLRPMIRETLRFDLRLLSIFMHRLSSRLYPNIDVDLKKPLEDFKNATLRETDYISEAAFAAEMFATYKDDDTFVIPETYTDLCTPNIIVQEYLGGISAAHLVKIKDQGYDPVEYVRHYLGSDLNAQLETLGYEYVRGIFMLERIQGDPHPGNIRLLEENRVGLIDFGIFAKTPREKAAMYGLLSEYSKLYEGNPDIAAMFGQFMRFFSPELYRALDRINQLLPASKQSDDLARDIGDIAAQSFNKKSDENSMRRMIRDGSIIKTINQITNKDNRFGLVMRVESGDMLRAAQTYITLAESLGNSDVLRNVFARSLHQIASDMSDQINDDGNQMSVGTAVETIAAWLERVAERDPSLFSVLSSKIQSNEKEAASLEKTIKKEMT